MKFKRTYLVAIAIIAFVILIANNDLIAQCSMCRKIASDGTSKREIGNHLNYAILYLMTIPYIALGFIFRKQISGFVRSFRSK